MKKILITLLFVVFVMSISVFTCFAEDNNSQVVFPNGDGTYSFENGIFLRHYDGYSEDAQVYLSSLDACYSIISAYAPIIDPYINGEKSFEDKQWNTIFSEVKYILSWCDYYFFSVRRSVIECSAKIKVFCLICCCSTHRTNLHSLPLVYPKSASKKPLDVMIGSSGVKGLWQIWE